MGAAYGFEKSLHHREQVFTQIKGGASIRPASCYHARALKEAYLKTSFIQDTL